MRVAAALGLAAATAACAPQPADLGPAPAYDPALASDRPYDLLRAAVDSCLFFSDDQKATAASLGAAGWTVQQRPFQGTYDVARKGVTGTVSSDGAGYCRFGAIESVGAADRLLRPLLRKRFAGRYERAGSGPCDGYTVTTDRGPISVLYTGLDGGATCPDPNGTEIAIRFSDS